MENKKINPDIDTTAFVNVDNEPFDIYINKQLVRHIDPNETHTLVYYVAQVGAKHLVDRILQKQGIKDTLRDTPLRKDLFARILPDIAKEIKVEPLSPDMRLAELEKQLKSQREESQVKEDKRDEEIRQLKEQIAKLVDTAATPDVPKGRKKEK